MTPGRWGLVSAGVVALLVSAALLVPGTATPNLAREGLWLGTVRRGDMAIEVRGPGVIAPREYRWIAAETPARIERVVARAGESVAPDTVVVEMSNSALVDQKSAADAALVAAEADLVAQRARLESQELDRQAEVAGAEAEYEQAKLQSEAQTRAFAMGVTSQVQKHMSEVVTESQRRRLEIMRRRASTHGRSGRAEVAAAEARLGQLRRTAELYARQVEALTARAGTAGVLQEVAVEAGQQVTAGTNLARVAREGSLMAQLRVAETQIGSVRVGQQVTIDLGDATVPGRVERIDPAVRSGTVRVDVELTGTVPASARPDLNVDGVIRISLLSDVLFVERPANVPSDTNATLFRLDPDGTSAERVQAELGQGSARTVHVKGGLREGDRVVLSDTSQWADVPRISLD